MTAVKQASVTEIKETIDDRDFWREAGAPLDWQLFGWTYRSSAVFLDEFGDQVEMGAAHVRLLQKVRADALGEPAP